MTRNAIAREFDTSPSRLIYGEQVGILPVWGTTSAEFYRLRVQLWMAALDAAMTTQQVRRVFDERKEEQDCGLHLIIRPEPVAS